MGRSTVLALARGMVVSGVLVASLSTGTGCDDGPPGCRAACEDAKTDLEDWGCQVDCSAPPWSNAATCSDCVAAFETCKVKPVTSCFCQKYYGDACDQ